MATPRKPGRKAAKSEVAAGLLNALTFLSVTKKPTETSLPYVSHTWLNTGYAIAFDGVIAAGHPIDTGIAGYPNTRLLIEALENSGKAFDMTIRENGAFDIHSGTSQWLVPSMAYDQVIPTPPDPNQWAINKAFIDALSSVAKVVSDTAPKLMHASIRLSGQSVMATNGDTIIEAWHGVNMPVGPLVPKAFATALAKVGKEPVGFGLAPDMSTITVWFGDGSWIRTQTYSEPWPEQALASFPTFFNGVTPVETPKGLFDVVKMVLPFVGGDNRVIIRPGLVRTHVDRREGAAIEIPAVLFSFDVNGKALVAVEDMAATFGLGMAGNTPTFVFFGATVRGVIAGYQPLAELAPVAAAPAISAGGWTTNPEPVQSPQGAGWGQASAPAFVSPPANVAPPTETASPGFRTAEMQRDPNKINGWDSPPPEGLLQDAAYRDQAGLPALDGGVDMGGWGMPAPEPEPEPENEFDPAAWEAANAAPAAGVGWIVDTPAPEPESGFGGWLTSLKDVNE